MQVSRKITAPKDVPSFGEETSFAIKLATTKTVNWTLETVKMSGDKSVLRIVRKGTKGIIFAMQFASVKKLTETSEIVKYLGTGMSWMNDISLHALHSALKI